MKLLRNPEVRRVLWAQFGVLAVGAIVGLWQSLFCAGLIFAVGLALCGISLWATAQRYHRLEALSASIDDVLHQDAPLFAAESEGELAILQSQIRKLLLQLRKQNGMLLQEKTALADALADISHQLKTPLTSMNILISLLRVPVVTGEKRMELTRKMMRLSEQLDSLLVALLKLSKLDAGAISLCSEPVSVERLLRAAAESLEIPLELKGITLIREIPADVSFCGDGAWSAEAFSNLIKNCMEHTGAGGEIRLSATENVLYTEIVIADSGTGFSEAELPHVFERFYQGAENTQGFGIGLALAQKIILSQNGTIVAKNGLAGGAVFQIRFYKTVI